MISDESVGPFIRNATAPQIVSILGAMRAIAEAGRGSTKADEDALTGAAHYMFGYDGQLGVGVVPSISPAALAAALDGSTLPEDSIKFITVMAVIDGRIDEAKLALVLQYAQSLGIHERYLREIADAAHQRLQEALADMTQANTASILNRPWAGGDIEAWLLPYQKSAADTALVRRFENLGQLDSATFGHAFWKHFKKNSYAFPGEQQGLNAVFSVPHDSVHVLTGYTTSGRGEILVSTFTASMHRDYPMAGHVLPAIFSWHLKVQINPVAKSAPGSLDPVEVWRAWTAGAQASVDTFAPDWDFWAHVARPLGALREDWSIPSAGLEATP
ncbi:MAG: hypothetical protein M3Z96_11960 [Pseudomonadota bacterium]|nr:hypothetical protein [Pseudomonadota bacterium]